MYLNRLSFHSIFLSFVVIVFLFVSGVFLTNTVNGLTSKRFPNDFKWGVGSSSYQIEGGWNADDKGESIWDYMTHHYPEKIADKSNGDVTSDSYHFWSQDVQMVRELNVNLYRFSISWVRILPNGYSNVISHEGLRYYNNLIDELLKYNITPMVTIYHWDLPQRLQELGGWTNPEIIDLFRDYAKILFEAYGDKVKLWTTINEPWHVCENSYGVDCMAPALNYPGIPSYLCGHNLLKAHLEVVNMYRNQFQATQKGKIGITLDVSWPEPKTDSDADKEASEMAMQFYIGWFGHPIFSKEGNYPKIMIDRINAFSKEQGYSKSRLPKFTSEEIRDIRGTSDFFGINSYTTKLVTKNDHNNSANFPVPSFNHDMGVVKSADPKWKGSASHWLHVVPYGMYKLLMWIKKEYNNPLVLITENGVSDKGGLDDYDRVDYYNSYLREVLNAIENGCNIKGYIAWSLMDSYEWKSGFTAKFGLYHVDFNHPNKTRTPKISAKVFAHIAKTNMIDWNYRPKSESAIAANIQLSSENSTVVSRFPSSFLLLCLIFLKVILSI